MISVSRSAWSRSHAPRSHKVDAEELLSLSLIVLGETIDESSLSAFSA